MLKVLLIILTTLFITDFSYSQEYWLTQSKPTTRNLYSCFFTDSLNGWIGGDSATLLHTANAGKSWDIQQPGVANGIKSLFFLNPERGFCLSYEYDKTPPDFYGSRILSTTNGGNTWSNYMFPDTNIFLNTIYFSDLLHGWTAGSGGKLYYTTNGGSNWNSGVVDSGPSFNFSIQKIKFYDLQTGYAVGGAFDIAGIIWKTTNGGLNWKSKFVGAEPVNDFHIIDSINILGVGGDFEYGASNVTTSNGGAVWNYTEMGIFGIANSVEFRTESEAWTSLGFVSSFLLSTNKGESWTMINTPGGSNIYDICFTNEKSGWAVGNGGSLLKYNSNLIGITDDNNLIPGTAELYQNYPNPFNPTTTINYNLKVTNNVSLKVFDVLGNEVRTLVNEKQIKGNHAVEFKAENLSSGIYFYRIESQGFSQTKRMILVK